MKKILAVIKKKIGLFKKDVYKTFVDQLIDGNTDEQISCNSEINEYS